MNGTGAGAWSPSGRRFLLYLTSLASRTGFVSLVVPHAVRLPGATACRWLLPLSVSLGDAFLALAETLDMPLSW